MAELLVIKTGFDGCYEALMALSARLSKVSGSALESSEDTSITGEREQNCCDELVKMARILASLADETAKDVKLTKARYVLADQ